MKIENHKEYIDKKLWIDWYIFFCRRKFFGLQKFLKQCNYTKEEFFFNQIPINLMNHCTEKIIWPIWMIRKEDSVQKILNLANFNDEKINVTEPDQINLAKLLWICHCQFLHKCILHETRNTKVICALSGSSQTTIYYEWIVFLFMQDMAKPVQIVNALG